MTTDLVSKAMMKAYNLRQPSKGWVFHSDRGSQYTRGSTVFCLQVTAIMGDVGAGWDYVVVERFFGSLKYDWLLKVPQPTREHMRNDATKYMRYYNVERLHTVNESLSPVEYEQSFLRKVS